MRFYNQMPRVRIMVWEVGTNLCRVITEGFSDKIPKDKKKLARQRRKQCSGKRTQDVKRPCRRKEPLTEIVSPEEGKEIRKGEILETNI